MWMKRLAETQRSVVGEHGSVIQNSVFSAHIVLLGMLFLFGKKKKKKSHKILRYYPNLLAQVMLSETSFHIFFTIATTNPI